jgi:hypothetical protein
LQGSRQEGGAEKLRALDKVEMTEEFMKLLVDELSVFKKEVITLSGHWRSSRIIILENETME